MKKLLVLMYVLVVASLSISARAETNVPLFVDSITYDEVTQTFMASGQYPNPCVVNPKPFLSQTSKGDLVLTLKAESNADFCVQVVGPKFIVSIDLHTVKSLIAELGLDRDSVHTIHNSRLEPIAEVDFSSVYKRISFEATEISGLLVSDESGLYVQGAHGTRVQIRSHIEELESLNNVSVTLTGHMMTHSVSNPFNSNLATPQFIATGVSFSIAD